jgi:hypothetical protein
MNDSAVQKGLFRAIALKKYSETIKKNPASSQMDVFMRPSKDKVDILKDANYDKLTEEGYAKEETVVADGDVIIGMVTPKPSAKEDERPYKDSSTIYKSLIPGAIDKVITGLNNDGYPIIKLRVRSERIPIIGDKFACYDDKTEVLTDQGWIHFKDLTKQHKVATLVDGKKLVYETPEAIQHYNHDGKMYQIDSNQINLCVTPNHKMWTATRGNDGGKNKQYKLERADEIIGMRRFYQKNVDETENVKNYTKFHLKGTDKLEDLYLPIEAWITLVGIWYAEGYCEDFSVRISANKLRVKLELDRICKEMDIKMSKCVDKQTDKDLNSWRINDKRFVQSFKKYSVGAVNKSLPSWVWKLNKVHSRMFITAMCLGDGHKMKGTTNTYRYDTSSIQLRDDFQRLCLQAGWSANYILKAKAGTNGGVIDGRQIKSTADAYRLTIVTVQNNPKVNKDAKNKSDKMIDYKGQIHCCTVPSGVIYVRREGRPAWCGNSRAGQKGTVGNKPHRADMPFTESKLIPDIIINPNCIPKRMTIGQLIECLLAKVCAIKGISGDSTPFMGVDVHKINDELVAMGYEAWSNETMYSGMTGVKMATKIFIGPTYYQRLKQMVGDKAHCLSTDHEVLTLDGWKFHNELSTNDKVATLVDDKLVYQNPTKVFYYPDYKGDMYHIKTQQLDLMVTPHHRMWVSKKNEENKWSYYDFEFAKDIVGKCRRYKTDIEHSQTESEPTVNHDNTQEQVEEIIKNYDQPVFCLEVPGGVFYVRRNGKGVWTGNSRARGTTQLLTRQPPEGKLRWGINLLFRISLSLTKSRASLQIRRRHVQIAGITLISIKN